MENGNHTNKEKGKKGGGNTYEGNEDLKPKNQKSKVSKEREGERGRTRENEKRGVKDYF